MGRLTTERNLADPDAVYRMLTEAHRGLSEEESAALSARLVLLLANHAGDAAVIAEAIAAARAASEPRPLHTADPKV